MGKNMENMEHDSAGLNVNDTSDVFSKVKRHGKYVYSRDFLMSFGSLEHCKSQPTGIDPVLLRSNSPESIDGMITIAAKSSRGLIQRESDNGAVLESHLDLPEWRRSSSFKNEFPANNSSPRLQPNWGDNGTGKINSSGQRNQLHSDRGSADPSGQIHGGGLSLAHACDGLLGSGGLISPHGGLSPIHRVDRPHASGRAGDQRRLHTAKASSFSYKEDNDLLNNETFGSGEGSDEARAEKEQRRKESFKQMRKEQRNKLRDVGSKSFHGFRENRENGLTGQSNEGLVSSLLGTPKPFSSMDGIMKGQNKGACIVASPPTTPRPLVPPGFSKVAVQRSLLLKELGHSTKVVHDTANVTTKEIYMKLPSRFNVKEETNTAVGNNDPHSLGKDDDSHPAMSKFARWFPSEETNFQMSEQRLGSQMGSPEMSSVTSEVESSTTRISLLLEDFDGSESRNHISHGMSSSVASLLPINSEGPIIPMPIGPSLEDVERLLTAGSNGSTLFSSPKSHEGGTSSRSSMMGVLSGINENEKPCSEASPVFLKCEDLEQHLLGNTVSCQIANSDPGDREENVEYAVDMSALFQRRLARNNAGQLGHAGDTVLDATDNNASRHIMMLLQKGAPAADDKAVTCENICSLQSKGPDINQLETLFGRAFVSELRHGSAGEPVSAKAPVHPSNLQLQVHDVLPNSCASVSGFGFKDVIEQKFSHHFPQHNKIEQNGPKDFIGPHIYDASWADLFSHNMVHAGNAPILDSRLGEPFAGQFGPSALPCVRHMLHPQLPFSNGFYSSTHHMFPKAAPHNKYHDSQLWGAQTMPHMGSFADERSQLSRTDHMTSYNAYPSQAIRMGFNPQITGTFNSIRSIGPLQHGMRTAVPVPEMHGSEDYENGTSFHLDSHFDSHSRAPRGLRSGY